MTKLTASVILTIMQVYFLSVLLNALSGVVLLTGDKEESAASGGIFGNTTFRLCLGAASALVGVLKLLAVVPGNAPIIGDILPSLSGLAAGGALLFDFYKSRATTPVSSSLEKFVQSNKKTAGIAAIAAAVLHFLFPGALFL